MANGYRLEQKLIISRVKDITTRYAEIGDFESYYRECWNFYFELQIDLKNAIIQKDTKRIELYEKSINSLSTLVASIISEQHKLNIKKEFGLTNDE